MPMTVQPKPDDRVQILEHRTPYQGYFRIQAYRLRHRTHNGDWTPELRLELFERGKTAVVMPYDPVLDTVVMIEQFRIGAYASGGEAWLVDCVAGRIDPGEDPEQTVRREAVEEAGCRLGDIERIGAFLLTPGACSEHCTMFCGRVDSKGVGGIHGLAHEHEDIRVFTVGCDEAYQMLRDGKIRSASTIIALQWLEMNETRI